MKGGLMINYLLVIITIYSFIVTIKAIIDGKYGYAIVLFGGAMAWLKITVDETT